MENLRNKQVLWHMIEADNSMTLQQGEGCVLSILLAESPLGKSLANGAGKMRRM